MIKRILDKMIRWLLPQPLFIENITGGFNDLEGRALLYYKTAPLNDHSLIEAYEHTNNWEINEIVRILNTYGFVVDVVDRALNNFEPEDKYDLFIGLGAGNSGKYFSKYSARMTKAVKVLYAAGPEPRLSDHLVRERYDAFNSRHGLKAPYMRIIDQVNFTKFLNYTDYILAIGEYSAFCHKSYQDCGKEIKSFLPSSSPNLGYRSSWINNRKRNKFLCFAGNGLICKGVDILIEAFRDLPEMKLVICGPREEALFEAYEGELTGQGNINFEGFVKVNSEQFNRLCSECAYVILNSASEGCVTSVTTCMRCGLVPIINKECGIETDEFGFMIDNTAGLVSGTIDAVKRAASISAEEYSNRVYKTLMDSLKYTQSSFSTTIGKALFEIMQEQNFIKIKTRR